MITLFFYTSHDWWVAKNTLIKLFYASFFMPANFFQENFPFTKYSVKNPALKRTYDNQHAWALDFRVWANNEWLDRPEKCLLPALPVLWLLYDYPIIIFYLQLLSWHFVRLYDEMQSSFLPSKRLQHVKTLGGTYTIQLETTSPVDKSWKLSVQFIVTSLAGN
jgi:hypothetical protein